MRYSHVAQVDLESMFCEIVLAPERVHAFYESIRGGDLYLRWYLGITFKLIYTEKGEHQVYTLVLLMVELEKLGSTERRMDRCPSECHSPHKRRWLMARRSRW